MPVSKIPGAGISGGSVTVNQSAPDNSLVIDSSGNVGIGTSSPRVRVDNTGSFRSTGVTDPTSGAGLELCYRGTVADVLSYNRDTSQFTELQVRGNPIAFLNGGGERMRINSSGNVGIGTTTPAVNLTVNGSTNPQIAVTSPAGTGAFVTIAAGGTTINGTSFDLLQDSSGNGYVYNRSNANLIFGANNTERMRIDSVGRVTTPFQTAFRAFSGGNTDYSTPDTKIQVHNQISYNVGNNYSTSTFRFTAPVAGIYMFIARCWANAGNTSSAGIFFKKNGSAVGTFRMNESPVGYTTLQPITTVSLAVNDYVELFTEEASATGIIHTSSGETNSLFAGYLLG